MVLLVGHPYEKCGMASPPAIVDQIEKLRARRPTSRDPKLRRLQVHSQPLS